MGMRHSLSPLDSTRFSFANMAPCRRCRRTLAPSGGQGRASSCPSCEAAHSKHFAGKNRLMCGAHERVGVRRSCLCAGSRRRRESDSSLSPTVVSCSSVVASGHIVAAIACRTCGRRRCTCVCRDHNRFADLIDARVDEVPGLMFTWLARSRSARAHRSPPFTRVRAACCRRRRFRRLTVALAWPATDNSSFQFLPARPP